jgi:hypothetical protein
MRRRWWCWGFDPWFGGHGLDLEAIPSRQPRSGKKLVEPRLTIQDLGSLGELIAASRTPNSDLNSINASFGTDPTLRAGMREVLTGSSRTELEPDQRLILDFHHISITNLQEQLAREIREGIVTEFEARYELDPSIAAQW